MEKHFYGFRDLKDHWVDDSEFTYNDKYFENKSYTDHYFDTFEDMDQVFGHEYSLFGTRGLPVGHPNRSSRSFNQYRDHYGPMIVRVIKYDDLNESISRIRKMMGLIKEDFDKILPLSNVYNKEVEKLQEVLKSKNYFIGNFGPNKDGVDGKYGKKTRSAHIAFLQGIKPEDYNSNIKQKPKIDEPIKPEEKKDEISTDRTVDVILMGGLDDREGYKDIKQQVELLKTNLGGKNVIGHRYTDINGVKKSMIKYPDAYVVLFSAGCKYSSELSSLIKDKTKLFIVEPYVSGSITGKSVRNAVSQGVPSKNVITGPNPSRGSGVVSDTTTTPKGVNHWGALKFVGSLV